MDTVDVILSRRSVREYDTRQIEDETLRDILSAGMAGPSCVNARDWSFLVVRDRETLQKMADCNGRSALPLRNADVGILICGDLDRAFRGAKEYWVIDGAIAGQNMVLAAASMGIGSVWLGTWPQMDKVEAQRELFNLPENMIPHSIIALGYPAKGINAEIRPEYEEDRVHYENW